MASYLDLLTPFLFSIFIGLVIGVEREYAKKKYKTNAFGGVRTFILISILGGSSAYLSLIFQTLWFVFISLIIVASFVLINYMVTMRSYKEIHTTTGISAILVFILSAMVFYGFWKIAVAISVLMAILLASRIYLHSFIAKITKKELNDTLKFAIITLIILPFLPNKAYGPLEVFNPYIIWLMVVFVSAISFVGYILIKIFGANKGISITGLVGGLVSSTAVAMSFSEKSKNSSKRLTKAFSLAIIIASTTMFFRILFEVLVVNPSLLDDLIVTLGVMALAGIAFSYYYFKSKKTEKKHELELKSPFTLLPALKFGLFFAFILFLSKAAQLYLGTKGVYLTSIFSGLADVDAITLSMSQLSSSSIITEKVASSAITLAALSNTVIKGGIVYFFGSKELRKNILMVFGIILIIGLFSLFF